MNTPIKHKIVALVPMRHHSERVPQKNFRNFCGQPLYVYIVNTLLKCAYVDSICIDTDSPVIKDGVARIDKKIIVIDRPKEISGDSVPMNHILLHDVSCVDAEWYVQTHSTNPLLKSETIDRAIIRMLDCSGYDSLFGVTKLHTRLWGKDGKPINHDMKKLERTQDLPPIYEENSNIYIFSKKSIMKCKNRIGIKPLMYEISKQEALDIDNEDDFVMAELLYRLRMQNEK